MTFVGKLLPVRRTHRPDSHVCQANFTNVLIFIQGCNTFSPPIWRRASLSIYEKEWDVPLDLRFRHVARSSSRGRGHDRRVRAQELVKDTTLMSYHNSVASVQVIGGEMILLVEQSLKME